MRRLFACISLLLALLCLLSACGSGSRNAADYYAGEDGIDLDLTRLSPTMVYSEVYNMRYEPDSYYGKVVRIEGLFSSYEHPETGEPYFNCIIPDATACCSQGLQFFPSDEGTRVYPDDYPKNGDTVVVVGTFTRDEENLYMCALTDASMEFGANAERKEG